MAPRAATNAARDCLQCHATPYGDTVIVVDVAIEFNDAPIWLVPVPVAVASPLLPDTLLTVATLLLEELHFAVEVMSLEVPSL